MSSDSVQTSEAFVKVVHGPDDRKGWHLDPAKAYVAGRSHRCNVRLSDPTVSATHAEFTNRHGIWIIDDLESSHGTRVNNHRILRPKPLFHRDLVRLGKTVLEFLQYEPLQPGDVESILDGVSIQD